MENIERIEKAADAAKALALLDNLEAIRTRLAKLEDENLFLAEQEMSLHSQREKNAEEQIRIRDAQQKTIEHLLPVLVQLKISVSGAGDLQIAVEDLTSLRSLAAPFSLGLSYSSELEIAKTQNSKDILVLYLGKNLLPFLKQHFSEDRTPQFGSLREALQNTEGEVSRGGKRTSYGDSSAFVFIRDLLLTFYITLLKNPKATAVSIDDSQYDYNILRKTLEKWGYSLPTL